MQERRVSKGLLHILQSTTVKKDKHKIDSKLPSERVTFHKEGEAALS